MTATDLREFHAGDILFREGDASETVLRLVSGVVQIQREVGGQAIVLGHVNEGEFIGEMGAIENRPHIATALAETDGVAEVLSVGQFFDRIASDPASALELILRLSARLRNADDDLIRYGPAATEPQPVQETPPTQRGFGGIPVDAAPAVHDVTIAAETAELREQIGDAPIAILERPFVVGRQLEGHESWPEYIPQLVVRDTMPFLISRNHFMIESRRGHLIVRDLNSKLGTSVNGQPIGRHFAKDSAPLEPGVSIIVAGGRDSRFQFRVTVS